MKLMWSVETDAVSGTAQTIVAQALGFQYGVSQSGRLGTEIHFGGLDQAQCAAQALKDSGYQAQVS